MYFSLGEEGGGINKKGEGKKRLLSGKKKKMGRGVRLEKKAKLDVEKGIPSTLTRGGCKNPLSSRPKEGRDRRGYSGGKDLLLGGGGRKSKSLAKGRGMKIFGRDSDRGRKTLISRGEGLSCKRTSKTKPGLRREKN